MMLFQSGWRWAHLLWAVPPSADQHPSPVHGERRWGCSALQNHSGSEHVVSSTSPGSRQAVWLWAREGQDLRRDMSLMFICGNESPLCAKNRRFPRHTLTRVVNLFLPFSFQSASSFELRRRINWLPETFEYSYDVCKVTMWRNFSMKFYNRFVFIS